MSDCVSCGAPLDCPNIPDSALYSLQDGPLPFVINCPPGYDCQSTHEITLACCNQTLHATFPGDATQAEIQAIIAGLVKQCQVLQSACGQLVGGPVGPGPVPTQQLYYNKAQTCEVLCPDGTPFSYTERAGLIAGSTQLLADQTAYAIACTMAAQTRVCPASKRKPTVDAYWTLDETGSADRVDKVHGVRLVAFHPPNFHLNGQPALFSNGVGWLQEGNTSLLDTNDQAQLAIQSANGFSIFGWFKLLTWPANGAFSFMPFIDFEAGSDPHPVIVVMAWNTSSQRVTFSFTDNNHVAFVPVAFTPVVGQWTFFHLFCDKTGKVGYSMNNGAKVTATGTAVFGSTAFADFFMEQLWQVADIGTTWLLTDEVGLKLSSVLTDGEVSYLYNNGAGKTWPL